MLCCIIVGHSFNSQGARNSDRNESEYIFNDRLANAISRQFYKRFDDQKMKIQIVHRETYKTLPDKVNYFKPDFAISLHSNAFDKKVSGSEVLYYNGSVKGKIISDIFSTEFKKMNIRHRGSKSITHNQRGGFLLSKLKCPAIIAEPFFIDNTSDLDYVNERFGWFVDMFLDAIEKCFRGI